MDNSISTNPWYDEKIKKYIEIIKEDSVDVETYKEICAIIPDMFLVEKDRIMWNMPWISLTRKTTKREFDKKKDKVIIDKLKVFAQEKKLWLGNQLAFNDHFEKLFVWTIYFIET